MLKAAIERDLKTALLSGDKMRVNVLRGIKSAILYEEVAKGLRDSGLEDNQITDLLKREAKKRQDSADLFERGGESDRAATELSEKSVIEGYLPKQLSDAELVEVVDKTITDLNANSVQQLGQVISEVKQRANGTADGVRIASLVKERLNQR